jgi:type II secretory pathway component GspD/PulD (secretin)
VKRIRSAGVVALMGLVVWSTPTVAQEQDPNFDPSRPTSGRELLEQRRQQGRERMLEEQLERDAEPQQPGEDAEQGGDRGSLTESPDGFTIDALSEPMDLRVFIELVADLLEIQIIERSPVTGTIVINSPKVIPPDQLLNFLEAMLDQWDYALTYDEANDFYIVQSISDLGEGFGGERAPTQMIFTPNIKPSSLKAVIESQSNIAATDISYVDELGVIVVRAPPVRAKLIRELIDGVLAEIARSEFIRIPVTHLAADAARQRAIELVGRGGTSGLAGRVNRGGDAGLASPSTGGQLDNLSDRLTIDTQGNALIFRGRQVEIEQVQRVMAVIDKPNTLIPRRYFAGASASQIADIAKQRGLGEVTILNSTQQQTLATRNVLTDPTGQNPFAQQTSLGGGSGMVVDPERGNIIYYATPEQHEQMDKLIEELDPGSDRVVIRAYKLAHADATTTAELILSLIDNQRPTGEGALLPQNRAQQQATDFDPTLAQSEGGEDGELSAIGAGPDVFVIADEANNQIIVKSPLKQQDEFRKLIEKIDLRRPQVYIQASIVAVSDQRKFELAVESQLLSTGDPTGALQSNFGSFGGDDITNPATVGASFIGLTAAVIKSEYVPFVLTALEDTDQARIVSSPQLLVDDNEEARLISVEQQATTTTSQDGTSTQTGFGGFQDAGTELTVTPRISEGGYLQLNYEVQLSNFVGEGENGIPGDRQERTVGAESVTIPSDRTIIVGGIKVVESSESVLKVPLLGDIPLIGFLFRETTEVDDEAYLYVFITPKIMSDPNFYDLELLTRGPQAEAELDLGVPQLEPAVMEIIVPKSMASTSPAKREDEGEAGMIRRRDGG